jgi:S-adenosyl-L-methionine hydrolase (adenosine-forming)
VGTARRGIAVEVADGEGVLVGPDNGLLAPAVAMAGGAGRAVEITNPHHRLSAGGATFAGRDVFAPAVAHLCNGGELTDLGDLVDADLLMPGVVPLPQIDDTRAIAQVLWVDRFGNAQLNLGPDDLPGSFGDRIEVRCSAPTDPTGGVVRSAVRATTYAELSSGAVGLVVDSSGLLALSMDQRSAADELRLVEGDQVTLVPDAGEGTTQRVTLRPTGDRR